MKTCLRVSVREAISSVVPAPVEPEPYKSLRAKAEGMGIEFYVECNGVNYDGVAGPRDRHDGPVSKPFWSVEGPTQEQAARNLLNALSSPPNVVPKPEQQCDPPVSSTEYYRGHQ